MAQVFLSATFSVVLDRLGSIVESEKLFEREFTMLSNTVVALRGSISDAEERLFHCGDVKDWLRMVEDVCQEIDSLLDEWEAPKVRSKIEDGESKIGNFSKKVRFLKLMPFLCPLSNSHKVDLRRIVFKIKELNLNLVNIWAKQGVFIPKSTRSVEQGRKIVTPFLDCDQVYGRDDEKSNLVHKLFLGTSKDVTVANKNDIGLNIIPIVGMAGIGKTTLAQCVLNDEEIKAHFDPRISVHVGYHFDSIEVAQKIITAIIGQGPDAPKFSALENLYQFIAKCVSGKRLLLVLDDVWTEDEVKWLQLKGCLQHAAVGSAILVTTQKEQVAIMMRAQTKMIRLELLSEEQSWCMFSDLALSGRDREECSQLEDIGAEIVRKCDGLPLAIKVIGNFMKNKQGKQEWKRVLQNALWKLDVVECKLFSPFFLTYYDLPTPLKHCFSYCSLFPQNYTIDRTLLIELWMSQGFIKDFETGENCFESLVMRSFFHDVAKNYDGKIEKFKIHYILQEFALSVCQGSDIIYHCNLSSSSAAQIPLPEFRKCRTLVLFDSKMSTPIGFDFFSNLKLVRALSLCRSGIKELPISIGKLIHLRYLNLSHHELLKEVPPALCDLHNLQTLRLNHCTRLERLPERMDKLVSLFDLGIEGCMRLAQLPKGIQRLTRLQHLDMFVAPYVYHKNNDRVMMLSSLNKLKLQGCLRIQRLGNVEDVGDAEKARLRDKDHLVDLKLNFSQANVSERTEIEWPMLLEALQPHQNLKFLKIDEYYGPKFSDWIASLSNLKSLTLARCHKCELLPPLGNLPSLVSLHIEELSRVERVGLEFLGIETCKDMLEIEKGLISFPKLEDLCFKGLFMWKEWSGLGSILSEEDDSKFLIMPRLVVLEISCCENLEAFPGFIKSIQIKKFALHSCPILQKRCRVGVGQDWHKICHIPNIVINNYKPKFISTEETELEMTEAAVADDDGIY